MILENLGYTSTLDTYRIENNLTDFEIGRIILEHKERYIVKTEKGELDAEITGNMRFSAQSREEFPAIGDWVAVTVFDGGSSIIHTILPRQSMITRQAVGKFGEAQIIATNIDYAFLVQAVDRDFNINRFERYLTICNASKVQPVIVLTKTDLIDEEQLKSLEDSISNRIKGIPVIAISNQTHNGIKVLKDFIEKSKTYCLLGSSGVGKSTLTNNLTGKETMKTNDISASTNKGRHVTSHRELIVLDNGGIIIDNPGMREVGIADTTGGLKTTFDTITRFAKDCRFKDCSHTGETGCAVIKAVENGDIDKNSYENFLKIEREKEQFELTVAEKRKKDKNFGKMVKNYKKDMKRFKK